MKILVVGEKCVDRFRYGRCERLNPEAPVPVFNPISETENDGMAGNVSANLRSLGAEVELVSNVELMEKIRYVEIKSNQMLLREDRNDKVQNSFEVNDINFSNYDAVVVSDYNKGFLTEGNLLAISRRHNNTFLDTKKPLSKWYMDKFKFIKINESEWNNSQRNGSQLAEWLTKLIITKGESGCDYMGENYPVENPSKVHDVAGAGDSFLAGLVFEYVRTESISSAINFANKCASYVVGQRGVSVIPKEFAA